MRASAAAPPSDMNAKLSPAEAAKVRRDFIVHSLNAQGEWLDGVMRKLLPKKLYRMAYDQSGTPEAFEQRQITVKQWLDRQDIRIVQQGLTQRIYQGRQLLSTFGVRLVEK